ncbi:MAG: hypothetical protein ACK4P8_04275 [Tabrizicola sp.]
MTAFFFHQVHLAEVKGWAHVTLVARFPVFTVSGIASMPATGWAVNRLGGARLVTGSATGPGVTGLLIDAGHDLPEQAFWIVACFVLAAVLAESGALVAQRLLPADEAGLAPCPPLR